jgi:outer membrane murein-binding lipoprotein Lpp
MRRELYRVLAVGIAVLVVAGCASTQKAEKSIDSLTAIRESLSEGKDAISAASSALNSLNSPKDGDYKSPYQDFISNVETIENISKKVGKLAEELQTNREQYFQEWERELASFQNQEMRQVSEQRLAEVRAKCQPIVDAAPPLSASFTPYLANISDIRRYLDLDLNTDSVQRIGGTITKAIADGKTVNAGIDGLLAAIDSARAAIAAKAQ